MSCWSVESALAPRACPSLCRPAAIIKPLHRWMRDVQTCSNPVAKEVSEGGYKNLALLDPPTCLPEFAFWPQTGGRGPHRKAPISFGRDKWEKRGLCPREAAGVVCLTSSGFWLGKKLVVEKPKISMFSQTGSSAFVPYFSGGGKPGSHQARMSEEGKRSWRRCRKEPQELFEGWKKCLRETGKAHSVPLFRPRQLEKGVEEKEVLTHWSRVAGERWCPCLSNRTLWRCSRPDLGRKEVTRDGPRCTGGRAVAEWSFWGM